jgi:hypothetical protein
VLTGQALFTSAGLPVPTIWETPGNAVYGYPAHSVQEILNEGQQNLAVTQGVASFYIEYDESISDTGQLVTDLKAADYTFVSPQSFLASNG